MIITLAHEDFVVEGKALVWPAKQAVIVTDVHLGKNSYFQLHGMLIPEGVLQHDLDRLTELMRFHRAERLIVLGDLFHHEKAFTPRFVETIDRWRQANPFEIILIEGNHDRRVQYPPQWGIVVEHALDWAGYSFRHDWDEGAPLFQMCGHLHPALSVGRGADRVRVPCFWLRSAGVVLPAFTELSGHANIRLAPEESAILVTPDGPFAYP